MRAVLKLTGEEHVALRPVLDCLRLGLFQIGMNVDILATGAVGGSEELIIQAGIQAHTGQHDGPVAIIDPVDGWTWSEHDIFYRNSNCSMLFGLGTNSCRQLRSLGLNNVAWLPVGLPPLDTPRECKLSDILPECAADAFWFILSSVQQARKGAQYLIDAFQAEFKREQDVLLLVKGREKGWNTCLNLAENKHIIYNMNELSRDNQLAMLAAADCIVAPSLLEGWGIVPLEAMALGIPTIVTDYGGHSDYANAKNSFLVPCREESMALAPREAALFREVAMKLHWGIPDTKVLQKQLRHVYETRPKENNVALKEAMQRTTRWFTPAYSAMQLVTALENKGIQLQRRQYKDPSQFKIAVAIPTLNYADLLMECLQSLRQTNGVQLKVFVYDDGSSDHTPDVVRTDWPFPIFYNHAQTREGLPHARHQLVEMIKPHQADYMCFLDGDTTIIDSEWLLNLAVFHVDGITGPKLLTPDGRIWGAGGTFTQTGEPTCRYHMQPDNRESNIPRNVPHVPGACMFMAMDLWDKGLECDLNYAHRWYDDTDLCYQVTENIGEHCWYRPESVIIHNAWSCRQHNESDLNSHNQDREVSRARFVEKWGIPSKLTYANHYKYQEGDW